LEDLSLHILDIAENSVRAGADLIQITIDEDIEKDILTIEIEDNGEGMDEETLEKVTDPFFTSKTLRKVGLGVSLLKEAARMTGGDLEITSSPGEGTNLRATFQYSHIDRKPIGDMTATMITLIFGNRDTRFIYSHKRNGRSFHADSERLFNEFNGSLINKMNQFKHYFETAGDLF